MCRDIVRIWLMTQPDTRLVKASVLLSRDEVMLQMLSGLFAEVIGGTRNYAVVHCTLSVSGTCLSRLISALK